MKIKQRDRVELLELIAELDFQRIEAEEKRQSAEENAAYWYQRYIGLEGNAHVQGVRDVAASAGVPGSAGNGADDPV